MIAQGWKDASIREIVGQLSDCFSQHVQIVVPRLIPDVVRRQIARPNDKINIL